MNGYICLYFDESVGQREEYLRAIQLQLWWQRILLQWPLCGDWEGVRWDGARG